VRRPPEFDVWIDMYGGEEFEKSVLDCIDIFDNVIRSSSDDASTLEQMRKHFTMSCRLEHMFWDQASTMMEWPANL